MPGPPRRLHAVADALELVGEVAEPIPGLPLVRPAGVREDGAEFVGERAPVDGCRIGVPGRGSQGGEEGQPGDEGPRRPVPLDDAERLLAAQRRQDHGKYPCMRPAAMPPRRLPPRPRRPARPGAPASPASQEPGRSDLGKSIGHLAGPASRSACGSAARAHAAAFSSNGSGRRRRPIRRPRIRKARSARHRGREIEHDVTPRSDRLSGFPFDEDAGGPQVDASCSTSRIASGRMARAGRRGSPGSVTRTRVVASPATA